MAERGITFDHTTIHRWAVRFSPLLLERFNRRKRAVTGKWHVDETYIKVCSFHDRTKRSSNSLHHRPATDTYPPGCGSRYLLLCRAVIV